MTRCPRCGWRISTLDSDKVELIRKEYPSAFLPWTKEQDQKLAEMVQRKERLIEMAGELGRQPSAITKRIQVLGLDIVKPEPEKPVNETSYLDNAVVGPGSKGNREG